MLLYATIMLLMLNIPNKSSGIIICSYLFFAAP